MFEDLLNSLLTRFLGSYIKDIEKEDLKLSVWKGDVHLKNLEIKPSALDFLDLPIEVKSGYIGDLNIKVPWKDLRKKQTKIAIKNVFVLACPKAELKYDPSKEEEKIVEMKRKKLKALEENEIKRQESLNEKEDNSFITNMLSKIIENFYMCVENVHIRYEDHSSNPNHPFCMGITLSSLIVSTPKESREVLYYLTNDESLFREESKRKLSPLASSPIPTKGKAYPSNAKSPRNDKDDPDASDKEEEKSNGLINKFIDITNFNVYWDSDQPTQIDIENRHQMTKEMKFALNRSDESGEYTDYIPQHYILNDVSVSLKVDADTRGIELRKPTPEKVVKEAFKQLGWDAGVMVNSNFRECYLKIREDAVRGRSKENERSLFIEQFKARYPKFCSQTVIVSGEEFIDTCWDISNTSKPIVEAYVNIDRFNIVLSDLQYRDMMCYMNQLSGQKLKARYAVITQENEKKVKQNIWSNYLEFKSKRNKYITYYKDKLLTSNYKNSKRMKKMQEYEDFFPLEDILLFRKMAQDELNLGTVRKTKSEEDEEAIERITENQRLQSYSNFSNKKMDTTIWEEGRPKDIMMTVNLRVMDSSLTLRAKTKDLFHCKMNYFYVRGYKRKEYLECWVVLRQFFILNDSQYRNTIYENMLVADSKGELFTTQDNDFRAIYPYNEKPFFSCYANVPLVNEKEPLEAAIELSNMSFIVNLDCLFELVKFFLPNINVIDTAVFEQKAFALLKKMRDSQKIYVDSIIENHRMIDAMIKIGNFDIIIPDGKSNLRDVSQILDIHIKQICISSDQPKGADNINMSASQSKMRFVDRLYDKYKIDVEDISIHLSFYKIEENPYIVNLEENRRKSLLQHYYQARRHTALTNIEEYLQRKVKKNNVFTIVDPFSVHILFEQSKVSKLTSQFGMKASISLSLMHLALTKSKVYALMRYASVLMNTYSVSQKKYDVDIIEFVLRSKKYTLGCLKSVNDRLPVPENVHDSDVTYIDNNRIGIVYMTDPDLRLIQDSLGMKVNLNMEGISIDIAEHSHMDDSYKNIINILLDHFALFYDDSTYDMNVYLQIRNVVIEDFVRSQSIGKRSYMFISDDNEVDPYASSITPVIAPYIETEDFNKPNQKLNFMTLLFTQMNVYSGDFNKYNSKIRVKLDLGTAKTFINIPTIHKLLQVITHQKHAQPHHAPASNGSTAMIGDSPMKDGANENATEEVKSSSSPVPAPELKDKEWDINSMLVNIKTKDFGIYLLSRSPEALLNFNIRKLTTKISMSPGTIYLCGSLHSVALYDMTKGSDLYPAVLKINLGSTEASTPVNRFTPEQDESNFIQFLVNIYPSRKYPRHPGYGASVALKIKAPELYIRYKFVQELLNFMKSVEVTKMMRFLQHSKQQPAVVDPSPSTVASNDNNRPSFLYSVGGQYGTSSSFSMEPVQELESLTPPNSVNVSPLDQLKSSIISLIYSLHKSDIICDRTSHGTSISVKNNFELPHINIILNNLIINVPRNSQSKEYIQFEMGQFEFYNDHELLFGDMEDYKQATFIFNPKDDGNLKFITSDSMDCLTSSCYSTCSMTSECYNFFNQSSLTADNLHNSIDENHLFQIHLIGMKLISNIYDDQKESYCKQLLLGGINAAVDLYLDSTLEVNVNISEIVFLASEFQLSFMMNKLMENLKEKPVVYDSPDIQNITPKDQQRLKSSVPPTEPNSTLVSASSSKSEESNSMPPPVKLSQDRKSTLYVLGTQKPDTSAPDQNIYNLLNDVNININQNGVGLELLLSNGGYSIDTDGSDIHNSIGNTENSLLFFFMDRFLCRVSLTNERSDISLSLKSISLKDTRLNTKVQENYKSPLLFGNGNIPLFSMNANITTLPAITFDEIKEHIEDYNDEMVNKIQCDIFLSYLFVIPTPLFMEILLFLKRIMPKNQKNSESAYEKAFKEMTNQKKIEDDVDLKHSPLIDSPLEEVEEDEYILEKEEENAEQERATMMMPSLKDSEANHDFNSVQQSNDKDVLFDIPELFDSHKTLIPSITLNVHIIHPSIYVVEDVTSVDKPVLLFTFDMGLTAIVSPLKTVSMNLTLENIRACYSQYDLSIPPPDIVDILQPFMIKFDVEIQDSFKHIDCNMESSSDMNIRLTLLTLRVLKNSLSQYLPYLPLLFKKKEDTDPSAVHSKSQIHLRNQGNNLYFDNTIVVNTSSTSEYTKNSIQETKSSEPPKLSDVTATLPVLKVPNIQQALTNGKAFKLTKVFFNIKINNISLVVVNDTLSYDIPLLQLNCSQFLVTLNLTSRDLVLIYSSTISGDYYNQKISVWEPLIEPYDFILQFTQVANQSNKCSDVISYISAIRDNTDADAITTINIHSPKIFSFNLSSVFINELLEAYNTIMNGSDESSNMNMNNSYYIMIENKLGVDCEYFVDYDGGINSIIDHYKNKNLEKAKSLPLKFDIFIVYEFDENMSYSIHHYWIGYFKTTTEYLNIYDQLPSLLKDSAPLYRIDSLDSTMEDSNPSVPTYFTLFSFRDTEKNHAFVVCTSSRTQFNNWTAYINSIRIIHPTPLSVDPLEDSQDIGPLHSFKSLKLLKRDSPTLEVDVTEENESEAITTSKSPLDSGSLNLRSTNAVAYNDLRSQISKSSEKKQQAFYQASESDKRITIKNNETVVSSLPSHPTLLLKAMGQNYQTMKHRMISIFIPECRSFATEVDKEESTVFSLTTISGQPLYDILMVNGISNGNKTIQLMSTLSILNVTKSSLYMSISNADNSNYEMALYKHNQSLNVPIQATQTGILKIGISKSIAVSFPLSYISTRSYPKFLNIGNEINPYYIRISVSYQKCLTKTNTVKMISKVILYPMFIVNNYLPEGLDYRIIERDSDKEDKIKEVGIIKTGTPYFATKYNILNTKCRIAFRPQNSRYIWPHYDKCIELSSNSDGYLMLESANHTPFYLHYIFKQDVYGTIICNVYVDYWIVNKTGLDLRLSQKPDKPVLLHTLPSYPIQIISNESYKKKCKKNEEDASKSDAENAFVKPYIFSHTKTKSKQQFVQLSTNDTKWSNKINIKAIGYTSTCVLTPSNPNDAEYILSVTVSHAPLSYSQSLVVTITHQYMLYNKLSSPILLRQSKTESTLRLLPSQVAPLYWSKSSAPHMFRILLQGTTYSWSPEISIDKQLEVDVELNKVLNRFENNNGVMEYTNLETLVNSEDKRYIHINTNKLTNFNCITFRDIPEFNLTYCISNCCTLDTVVVNQVNSSFSTAVHLNPFCSKMWIPPLPFEDLVLDVCVTRIDDISDPNKYRPVTRIHLNAVGDLTSIPLNSPNRTIYVSLEMEGTSKILLFRDIKPIASNKINKLEIKNIMNQQYDSRISTLHEMHTSLSTHYKEVLDKYDYTISRKERSSGRTSNLSVTSHHSQMSPYTYSPNINTNLSNKVVAYDMSNMDANSNSEEEALFIYLEQITDIANLSSVMYSYLEISDGNNLYTTQHINPNDHYINDNVIFSYDPSMCLSFNLYTDYKTFTSAHYVELNISKYTESNKLYNLLLPLKSELSNSYCYLCIQIMHTTIHSLLSLVREKLLLHNACEVVQETIYKINFERTIGTIYSSDEDEDHINGNDYNKITSIHKQRALNVGIFELYKDMDEATKQETLTPVSPLPEDALSLENPITDYSNLEKKMNFNLVLHEVLHLSNESAPLRNVYALVKIDSIIYRTNLSKDKEKEVIQYPTTPLEVFFNDYNIGLSFTKTSNDFMIVTEVYKDSEAANKHIIPGMILISINDLHQGYTTDDIYTVLNTNKRPLKMTFLYPTISSTTPFYKAMFEEIITFPMGCTSNINEYSVSIYEMSEDEASINRRSSLDTSYSSITNTTTSSKDKLLFSGTFPIHRYNHWTSTMTTTSSLAQLNMETYWSNDSCKQQILNTKIHVHFQGFGLSLIDGTPKELLYCHLNDMDVKFLTYESNKQVFELKIDNVQVDNEIILTPNEVLFGCENKKNKSFLHLSTMFTIQPNIIFFNYFGFALSSLFVSLDSHILLELFDFFMGIKLHLLKNMNDDGLTAIHTSSDFQKYIVLPTMNTSSMRIFAKFFQIHPFSVSISNSIDPAYSLTSKMFATNPAMVPIETMFSTLQSVLGNLDHVQLPFNSFITEDIFMYQDTLVNQLVNHYKYEGIKNAYKFIGGINILGNPIGLFENIGTGIKAFFYEPLQDSVQSAEELSKSLAKGGKVFLQTTTYGLINSARAVTGVIGDTLTNLTFDQEFKIDRASGKKGIVSGFTSGITGLYKEPKMGASKNGFVGALEGIGKGLIGVVTKPLVGVIDEATNAFDTIKDSTKLYEKARRSRLPRFIGFDHKVRSYCNLTSYGQYMLALNQNSKKTLDVDMDRYLFHCIVDNDTHILLITRLHIILMTDRCDTLWCLPLRTVETYSNGEELRLTYNNSLYTLVMPSEELCSRIVGLLKNYNLWTEYELISAIDTLIDFFQNQKVKKSAAYNTLPPIESLVLKSAQLIHTQVRYENKSNNLIKLNSNAYTEYVLEVTTQGTTVVWTVSRRYKEFQRYYQQLQKVLPKERFAGVRFPEKKMNLFGKHLNPEVEKERQTLFNDFIQNFVNQPDILALPCTNEFLKKNPVNMHIQK